MQEKTEVEIAVSDEQKKLNKAFLYFLTRDVADEDVKESVGDFTSLNARALYKLYFSIAENDMLVSKWSAALENELEEQIMALPVLVYEHDVAQMKMSVMHMRFMKALRQPLPITRYTVLITLAQELDALDADKQIGSRLLLTASEMFTDVCARAVPPRGSAEAFFTVYARVRDALLAEFYISLGERSLEVRYCDGEFVKTVAYLYKIKAFFGAVPNDSARDACASESAIRSMLEELKKGDIAQLLRLKENQNDVSVTTDADVD